MRPGVTIGIVVFVFMALAHALRLAFGLPVTVGSVAIPSWASVVAVVVALALAWLLSREACVARGEGGKAPGGPTSGAIA